MKWKERAGRILRRCTRELAFYRRVLKHPGTPRLSRFLLGAALAYAVSPVDLIPDFIPGIGYLDDVLVLPALIGLAIRLVPKQVIADCREPQGDDAAGPAPAGGPAGTPTKGRLHPRRRPGERFQERAREPG